MAAGKSKRHRRRSASTYVRMAVATALTLAALGMFSFIVGYALIFVNGKTIIEQNADKFEMPETTILYDANGQELVKLFHSQNRQIASLAEMPERLKQAFIATEDKRFHEHAGLDYWAIGRAIVKDIIHRSAVEGGSTITQQLAKNMFTNAEQTFFRKATEASIAVALESSFTKDQILEMYLNRIYFGNGAYGVRAAAERHFGISDLNKLTLGQMATLAGIPKHPSLYSPTDNPEKSKERRAVVLMLMRQQSLISTEEEQKAKDEVYPVRRVANDRSFFVDYAIDQVVQLTGLTEEKLYRGGYRIETTLLPQAQKAAEQAFAKPDLFQKDGPEQKMQGAAVVLDNRTGGIAAMVGGREYTPKGLNRVLEPRQPGSAIKPIAVYAPALEMASGAWNPYSLLPDEKRTYPGGYSPDNWDFKHAGQITMIDAVKLSKNTTAVWLLNEIGMKRSVDFLERLGIPLDAKDHNLAMALGGLSRGLTPLQLAQSYSAFANGGTLHKPHAIRRVVDRGSNVLYEHKAEKKQVMNAKTAYYMTEMMKTVVEPGGTGTLAKLSGRPVAGKTGSTQTDVRGVTRSDSFRDIWFAGYTPELTTVVWMGFDRTDANHFVIGSSGGAAKLFSVIMDQALSGVKATDFVKPGGVPDLKKPPEAVKDVAAQYVAAEQTVQVKWTPLQETNVVYRLYRKEKADADFTLVSTAPGASVIDLTVKKGTTYQYAVAAVRSENQLEGVRSAVVEVSVPEDSKKPSTPGGTGGTGTGSGSGGGTGGTGTGSGSGGGTGGTGTGSGSVGGTGGAGTGSGSGSGTGGTGTGSGSGSGTGGTGTGSGSVGGTGGAGTGSGSGSGTGGAGTGSGSVGGTGGTGTGSGSGGGTGGTGTGSGSQSISN